MRKIFTVILLLTALAGYAQKKKKGQVADPKPEKVEEKPPQQAVEKPADKPQPQSTQQSNPLIEHYLKKHSLALRWSDMVAAKEALYDLIAETGNDSLAYTLAVYYYENQQFAPSVLITKDLLARAPKNLNLLQLSAADFEGLGLREKALPNYESIYLLTSNTAILYKMVALQYETKLFAECKANVDILLTKPDLDSLKVTANMGQNKTKEFPVKVAILNIKGLLAVQAGDKAAARKSFQDALTIAPEYPEAKENLAKLK